MEVFHPVAYKILFVRSWMAKARGRAPSLAGQDFPLLIRELEHGSVESVPCKRRNSETLRTGPEQCSTLAQTKDGKLFVDVQLPELPKYHS